jgi:hypothetical protein
MKGNGETAQPSKETPDVETDSESETLSPDVAFLRDVLAYPESGVAARYKRLEISVRRGQKLKARLTQQFLVEEHEDRTSMGRIRTIRLTEKGRHLLEKHGIQNSEAGMDSGDETDAHAA